MLPSGGSVVGHSDVLEPLVVPFDHRLELGLQFFPSTVPHNTALIQSGALGRVEDFDLRRELAHKNQCSTPLAVVEVGPGLVGDQGEIMSRFFKPVPEIAHGAILHRPQQVRPNITKQVQNSVLFRPGFP